GTLGLALILTDDARRRELVRQARELLPWRAELHPEESAELCVRIHVPSEEHLANLLNAAEFAFRVEAVALAPGALGVQPQAEAEDGPRAGRTAPGRRPAATRSRRGEAHAGSLRAPSHARRGAVEGDVERALSPARLRQRLRE